MKKLQPHLPSALLLSYAIYSAFININIAHSIVLASLAGLFAYSLFLERQQKTNQTKEELRQFSEKWEKEMNALKELHESKLSTLEAEMGRVQLIVAPKSISASQGSNSRPVMKF